MTVKSVSKAVDPKSLWVGVAAAADPRTLFVELIKAYQAADVSKRPDGTPWPQVTTNLATEIVTVNGRKKVAFNEAYRTIAAAKGFDGADADPREVCNALMAEEAITGGWYVYPKKSGQGKVRMFKIAIAGDYTPATKPTTSQSDFGL